MRKLVLFMHSTLDGFVAGPGGEMDWIKVSEEIFDYASQTTRNADTALYGRVTYQMMESYWPTAAENPRATRHDIEHGRWYNNVDKVILSRTLKDNRTGRKIISDHIREEINRLKATDGKDIVIFGSPSASHALMHDNLIDEYWLFINPVILGRGIPLFNDIQHKMALNLVNAHKFSSGVVCLHYQKT